MEKARMKLRTAAGVVGAVCLIVAAPVQADRAEDGKAVAALDTEYQAAVKTYDVATIDRILFGDN